MSISIENLMAQVKADYGFRLKVHAGDLSRPMVGCRHVVTEKDRLHLGNRITQERCDALLAHDLDIAICACMEKIEDFDDLPTGAQEVLAQMAFRMGIEAVLQHKEFIEAIKNAQEWVLISKSFFNTHEMWLAGQPGASIAIEESHND
jgi:GH24 family phage-related lysozyme (muramidase)